jgi:protoporphyrinogen/coproporphyrinogen III oxidase
VKAVVVGGGISGLVAAYRLLTGGADVTLYEAEDRLGGKIHTAPFAGLPAVDSGADAFLARIPHAVELCRELGFADELVSPATGNAYIWARGELRRIPAPNFLGVPLDASSLAASGIVGPDAVRRLEEDIERTVDTGMPAGDESVGSLVRRRLGDEVLERLVDPLLGGIYAGDADRLSLRAGAPQLAAAAMADASLVRALRSQQAAAARAPGTPVFFAPPDGMGRVIRELETRLDGRIRRGVDVASIERAGNGWRVDGTSADVIVLATPAFVTARLLADIAPIAAARAASIEYAGVVLVTFAFARDAIARPLDASGFLVPKTERLLLTACSWASTKWQHLDRGDRVIVRASAGHFGNEHALALDDDVLVREMLDELRETMALRGEPVDVRIARWPRAFPQYTPGHPDRIDALDAALAGEAPGIALAGAAYRGIGIPACIGQANRATEGVLP